MILASVEHRQLVSRDGKPPCQVRADEGSPPNTTQFTVPS